MNCACGSFLAEGLHHAHCPNFVPTRELVTCGCGVVRNDEDPKVTHNGFWVVRAAEGLYEQPRCCRGCGSVYMLPQQQAPKG